MYYAVILVHFPVIMGILVDRIVKKGFKYKKIYNKYGG